MNREKMEEDLLRSFNQLSKETNVIYHNYAAANGMSDATFWILYTICYYGEGVTQKTICEATDAHLIISASDDGI